LATKGVHVHEKPSAFIVSRTSPFFKKYISEATRFAEPQKDE
jgi:hypothetical protein